MGLLKDLKDWLNRPNPMQEVMNKRWQEAKELNDRYWLLQNAIMAESSIQRYVDEHFEESKTDMIRKVNETLYQEAQEKGITLYQLCASVVPVLSYDIKECHQEDKNGVKVEFVSTIRLKPLR